MSAVRRLIAAQVNVDCTPYQVYIIVMCVICNHSCMLVFVTVFVLSSANINYSQDGRTPMIAASFKGHVDIVQLLIEAKAQLNRQTEKALLPL